MDFSFSSINSILTANPALAQLANNTVSSLTSSQKSAPKVQAQPSVVPVAPSSGMGTGKMLMIGAAFIGATILVLVFFRGRKG